LRIRIDRLNVGEAFDHLADVGSPLTKDIIADLAAAIAVAKRNGLEVYCKTYIILKCMVWFFSF
jgi:hypothetical protein